MKQTGSLVIISGFSGVGKGTVVKSILARHTGYALSVSCTTRKPREGEQEGISYFFRTKEEFEKMIADGDFLEYAQYVSHYYGTPRRYVEDQLTCGLDVILEIEIQGAMKVKEKFPEAILIFIMPPSFETLRERLTGRGSESQDVIEARLKRASEEAAGIEKYDYIFVNDVADDCADRIDTLIKSLRSRISNNRGFIEEIRKEIRDSQKGENS